MKNSTELKSMTAQKIIDYVKGQTGTTITLGLKNKSGIIKKAEQLLAEVKKTKKAKSKKAEKPAVLASIPTAMVAPSARKTKKFLVQTEAGIGIVIDHEPKVTVKRGLFSFEKTIVHLVKDEDTLAPVMRKGIAKKVLVSKFEVMHEIARPVAARKHREPGEKSNKDFTKYSFLGKTLSKGRLCHALIQKFVEDNNPTIAELSKAFPSDVIRPYGKGLFLTAEEAEIINVASKRTRFFSGKDEIIKIKGGKIAVTNQVNSGLIERILPVAEKLNLKVKTA